MLIPVSDTITAILPDLYDLPFIIIPIFIAPKHVEKGLPSFPMEKLIFSPEGLSSSTSYVSSLTDTSEGVPADLGRINLYSLSL